MEFPEERISSSYPLTTPPAVQLRGNAANSATALPVSHALRSHRAPYCLEIGTSLVALGGGMPWSISPSIIAQLAV